MKISFYNIFYPKDEKIIGYNTVSDRFVVLEPILYELLEASTNENNLEQLKEVHESFYQTLVENGFIVSSNTDELEEIKLISDRVDFDETNFELTINSTMNCNFKCWYCYESHIKDSKVSDETLDKIKLYIDNLINSKKDKLKRFSLKWFGGEPLLYFNKTILPLLKHVYPKMEANNIRFKSSFTTNAYLINQKLLDECKKYGVDDFQITLDGNRERHDKVRYVSKTKGSYDEIIDNIKLCLKNKFHVTARINISEETLPGILDIMDDFEDVSNLERPFLTFSFHKVWQVKKDLKTEISDIVSAFRLKNFTVASVAESSASIRSSCYADKLNQATINYNGDIFKCTAREFSKESRDGILESNGNIDWNEERVKKRLEDTRFRNKPCLECKILPICNGGCSQVRVENEGIDYCVHNFDEDRKMNLVKEKFNSRIKHGNFDKKSLNRIVYKLRHINYNSLPKISSAVFQSGISDFIKQEARNKNIPEILEMNQIYIKGVNKLRMNQFGSYIKDQQKIAEIYDSLELNENEEKITSFVALPVIAYYFYKLNDFQEALSYTNKSIENDDYFLPNHGIMHGHKIQQIHNIIRIYFKQNKILEACSLVNSTISHMTGNENLNYPKGNWKYKSYDFNSQNDITGLFHQIFSETVNSISSISKNSDEEFEYFQKAFGNLSMNKYNIPCALKPLFKFIEIKKALHGNYSYDYTQIEQWIDETLDSEWASFFKSLYSNLYYSIATGAYQTNKQNLKNIQLQK
ncbi:radical SAM/SPASM domain-containing protein [Zunongwangia sp. HGR-M22]|uniref:radical SAM/SPASM domain-containing protein n=1 Tax=Zunongwangia sp. HGR-M22 TaxID=3015168 RepID=UPI0022DCECA5|nr:radical SAM protein [Zunongwangia sp. HGR-M22]WBL25749.1 radical SAM protein [Zunongwangia sp. HGR-M22]